MAWDVAKELTQVSTQCTARQQAEQQTFEAGPDTVSTAKDKAMKRPTDQNITDRDVLETRLKGFVVSMENELKRLNSENKVKQGLKTAARLIVNSASTVANRRRDLQLKILCAKLAVYAIQEGKLETLKEKVNPNAQTFLDNLGKMSSDDDPTFNQALEAMNKLHPKEMDEIFRELNTKIIVNVSKQKDSAAVDDKTLAALTPLLLVKTKSDLSTGFRESLKFGVVREAHMDALIKKVESRGDASTNIDKAQIVYGKLLSQIEEAGFNMRSLANFHREETPQFAEFLDEVIRIKLGDASPNNDTHEMAASFYDDIDTKIDSFTEKGNQKPDGKPRNYDSKLLEMMDDIDRTMETTSKTRLSFK